MRQGQEAAIWFRDTYASVQNELRKVIVGQDEVVEGALFGLAANAHVLIEGMPGLGKTLLVRSLAQSLSLTFSRIQFTPDLMPADVTGTNVLAQHESGERSFEFRRGPIFANVLLADEINRATPKTQSAMLEAMQERFVTVGGTRHPLIEPFLVMATQNPIEQEGTYPLPEAQLDRFFLKLLAKNPGRAELAEIVQRTTSGVQAEPDAVASAEDVVEMRRIAREVPLADQVLDYALTLILALHPENQEAADDTKRYVRYGPSPRGAQALATAGRIRALLEGRYNVAKEDIQQVAKAALRHRLILSFEAEADGLTSDAVIDSAIQQVGRLDRDPISV